MKIIEHQKSEGRGGFLGTPVTLIYPFLEPDGDENAPVKYVDDDGEPMEDDLTPGFIVVNEANGMIELQYDMEWLWEPNWWPVELFRDFAAGIAKAAELSQLYAQNVERSR